MERMYCKETLLSLLSMVNDGVEYFKENVFEDNASDLYDRAFDNLWDYITKGEEE